MIFNFFDTQQLDPMDALYECDRVMTAASATDYLHQRYLDGHIGLIRGDGCDLLTSGAQQYGLQTV